MNLSQASKAKKEELQQYLQSISKELTAGASRQDYLNAVREHINLSKIADAPLETESDSSSVLIQTPQGEMISTSTNTDEPETPPIHSLAWHDFIMSQFDKRELIDGHPTFDGLRRLFETFIGRIINLNVDVLQCPEPHNNFISTVKVTIEYTSYATGVTIRSSDATSCWEGNTIAPYCNFAVATATTSATSRVLRKELRLRTIAAEEALSPRQDQSKNIIEASKPNEGLITDKQKMVINKLCGALQIKIDKFLNYLDETRGKTLEQLKHSEAQLLLRKLNLYDRPVDQGGEVIPAEII